MIGVVVLMVLMVMVVMAMVLMWWCSGNDVVM